MVLVITWGEALYADMGHFGRRPIRAAWLYFAGGLTQQSVSGWTAWGRQNSNPQFQNPFVIDLRLNYSWIKGAHTLKTGLFFNMAVLAIIGLAALFAPTR